MAPKERVIEGSVGVRGHERMKRLIARKNIRTYKEQRWRKILQSYFCLNLFSALLYATTWRLSISLSIFNIGAFILWLICNLKKLSFYLRNNSWRICGSFELNVFLYRLILLNHLLVVRSALYVVSGVNKLRHLFEYSPNSKLKLIITFFGCSI